MNPEAKRRADIYRVLAESEAGQDLLKWLKETADEKRRAAARLEPTAAWGRLQFADGLESVAEYISQVQLSNTIGKRNLK